MNCSPGKCCHTIWILDLLAKLIYLHLQLGYSRNWWLALILWSDVPWVKGDLHTAGNGNPLQDSCLENPMDGEFWCRLQSMGSLRVRHDWATSLSLFHLQALEKEMATHSSILAWRIPGTGEPGRLPSMGSHRVGHDWSELAAIMSDVEHLFMCFFLSLHFIFFTES